MNLLIGGGAKLKLKIMLRAQALLLPACATVLCAANFSGAAAFDYAKAAVGFGPRPAGSEPDKKLQAYIAEHSRVPGAQVTEDSFIAKTPRGDVPMKNIIVKFPGSSGRAIAITGHFDTKYFPGRHFVGANDGGSSTGLLIELAHVLAGEKRTDDVYVVFFDGEEAFGEWTGTDSVYGSRHLAEKWRMDGTLRKLKALINVDMIGDKSLNILQDTNSDPNLRRLVWKAAADLGYQAYFTNQSEPMDDDHMPFARLGVPVLDIIDFDYPPWHKDDDTLDKIGPRSLEIAGTVVVEAIHRLERQ
ncbi:MAG: M28 family peptidase [Bryobacterales bacterium]|nr:M28 family peptidase [Bryobacterales bacterium]MBV9397301.1 M28 family peptidase [Bryobacterales bacterium]